MSGRRVPRELPLGELDAHALGQRALHVHEQHGRAARARPAQRLGARLVAARHDEVAAVRAPQPRLLRGSGQGSGYGPFLMGHFL